MNRPGLLVSVRSAEEARAALVGGADLIDVKEPARGPLGRADDRTIREVLDAVDGAVPVSAAFGEWRDYRAGPIPERLAFVKWGLAGCRADWAVAVADLRTHPHGPEPVLVAYADHERAESPPPDQLVEAACEFRFPVFLFDTAVKDGQTLLDWLPESALAKMCDRLRAGGVRIALAGSLDVAAIRRIDRIAARLVRGSGGRMCRRSRRDGLSGSRPRTPGRYLARRLTQFTSSRRRDRREGCGPPVRRSAASAHDRSAGNSTDLNRVSRADWTWANRAAMESLVTFQECPSEPSRGWSVIKNGATSRTAASAIAGFVHDRQVQEAGDRNGRSNSWLESPASVRLRHRVRGPI